MLTANMMHVAPAIIYIPNLLAPPPIPEPPIPPTGPDGDPVTRISGNKIELTFTQPSNINGPLRYV